MIAKAELQMDIERPLEDLELSKNDNRQLFKIFFSAFKIDFTLLALKKLDSNSDTALIDLPA